MLNGQWNGLPCKFRVVNIIVGPEPEEVALQHNAHSNGRKRYLWFTPFVGQVRQAIEVVVQNKNQLADDSVFYLDNEDGSGYMKAKGPGMWYQSHATVYPAQVLEDEVLEQDWIKESTEELRKAWQEKVDIGWFGIDPEGYKQHVADMEALKQSARKRCGPAARIRHVEKKDRSFVWDGKAATAVKHLGKIGLAWTWCSKEDGERTDVPDLLRRIKIGCVKEDEDVIKYNKEAAKNGLSLREALPIVRIGGTVKIDHKGSISVTTE